MPEPDFPALLDPARLAAVRDALADSGPAAPSFDRLARLAARLLNVPTALITLITGDRQAFLGCTGLPEPWASQRETPLSHSLCRHVVSGGATMAIPDARRNATLAGCPALADLGVAAYAGVPLVLDGQRLGSLSVLDPAPREWTEEDLAALADLACSVLAEIRLCAETARRHRAEASLRMLEKALGMMPVGVTVTDLRGRITYANPAEAAMHGYAHEALPGMHASVFAPPELRAHPDDAPDRVRRWERESVNLRGDGSRFPVRLRSDVLTDEHGRAVGSVTCCEDLSGIRAAERAAAESETRFRFLIRTIPQQVWSTNAAGILEYASPATHAFYGIPPDGSVGDGWMERVHPEDRAAIAKAWWHSARTREPWEVEFRLRRHDGEYRWHRGRALAEFGPDGEIIRWYGTNTDITDQKAAAGAPRAHGGGT